MRSVRQKAAAPAAKRVYSVSRIEAKGRELGRFQARDESDAIAKASEFFNITAPFQVKRLIARRVE